MRENNPRLVYAALHGYRDGGPYSGQPAYDDVIQGQSGIAALMAQIAGEPRYAPMILADKTCALSIAGAVRCAPLFARERTGRGQFVEIPMFEQMVAFVLGEHLFGHNFVPPLGPLGYTRVTGAWRRPYKTKDGYLCMMAYTQAHWRKFWTMVGKPEICDDPRFDSIASRATMSSRSTSLPAPASPRPRTNGLRCCASSKSRRAHVEPRRPVRPIRSSPRPASSSAPRHPSEGEILFTDLPVRFGDARSTERLQPRLGEHSFEVLREAGFSDGEIEALAASGATSTAA